MIKEDVIKGVVELISNAAMGGTFHDAYDSEKCYYHKGHNCYIVPTIMLNKKFKDLGCTLHNMNPSVSAELKELGCKRTTRQLYEHCKCIKVVSCWIVPDNVGTN